MKYGGQLKAFSFWYPASSLYQLIADDNYRQTHISRWQWKQLINGSSLQPHCNKQGFNVYFAPRYVRVRLGFAANQQNHCYSPDSFIGLGGDGIFPYCGASLASLNTAGNVAKCRSDNGDKNAKAMGYIFVR